MEILERLFNRFRTDIELVTAASAVTGLLERASNSRGGALTTVGGATKEIRIFHGNRKAGSYFVFADGEGEVRIERMSQSEMQVIFAPKEGPSSRFPLPLAIDLPVTINDASGRTYTFRRFRHRDLDLGSLLERANA